jgi:hypothetical protein
MTRQQNEECDMKTVVECLRMLAYLIGLGVALINTIPLVGG